MAEPQKPPTKRSDSSLLAVGLRYSTMGFEFVGALGLMGYLGYRFDLRYSTDPWGLFVGLIMGMGLGLYTMIRQLAKLNR